MSQAKLTIEYTVYSRLNTADEILPYYAASTNCYSGFYRNFPHSGAGASPKASCGPSTQ